jgi:predicted AlkP superfamily pyrophosphatase or phosphodiesterase
VKPLRHAPRLLLLLPVALLALTVGACSSEDGDSAAKSSTPTTTESTTTVPALEKACKGKSRHVFVVGVDGLRSDSIEPADAPNLDRLYDSGTSTLHAYAGGELGTPTQQPTVSGPGWATILTGTWSNRHGILDNEFATWNVVEPNFLERINQIDPDLRLAVMNQWIPVRVLVHGAAERDEVGLGADVAGFAVDEVTANDPAVVFTHFDDVDHAGHDTGYGPDNPAYLAAVSSVDTLVGTVLDAIEARPGRDDECWATIVVTDHGGIGTGHGGQTPEERDIPLIVAGDGIEATEVAEGPGHDSVAPTALTYLDLPIDATWGWPEPFGVS